MLRRTSALIGLCALCAHNCLCTYMCVVEPCPLPGICVALQLCNTMGSACAQRTGCARGHNRRSLSAAVATAASVLQCQPTTATAAHNKQLHYSSTPCTALEQQCGCELSPRPFPPSIWMADPAKPPKSLNRCNACIKQATSFRFQARLCFTT